ncbi:hypothetical protein N7455_009736, partial [Penicillium solitum]|uniref:uncharacterized protein n=1 Tax=Penicillium solitum TaxID=60172 RepID=UPI0032C490F5
ADPIYLAVLFGPSLPCAALEALLPRDIFISIREFYSGEANSLFSSLGPTSYPRLYVPGQIPRQTELNISPATLFMGGKMHELVLDGTPDAIFAENANATGRNLENLLDQLKDI